MTQSQFGVWAAIAIHDTSSVVGAAARFGNEALQIATTVKLTRALWIVPLTLATAFSFRQTTRQTALAAESAPSGQIARPRGRVAIPWFIFWFVVASVVRTYVPAVSIGTFLVWDLLVKAAKIGLTITLFLIGASLTRKSIAKVGVRPLILGVFLWIVISCVSLWAVRVAL